MFAGSTVPNAGTPETPAPMSILFVESEIGKAPSIVILCSHGKSVPSDPRQRDAGSEVWGLEGNHGGLQVLYLPSLHLVNVNF
jgi:hypothetical protein